MIYKNVYFNDFVGNLEIKGEKLVFCNDKNSINSGHYTLEIPIKNIDKQKLKKEGAKMGEIDIETKNGKYHFQFNFNGDSEKFINEITKL